MPRPSFLSLGLALSVPLLASLPALAQSARPAAQPNFLNVATGSKTGTYSALFKDLGRVCTGSAYLRERGTTGSLENIDLLLGNQVSLAFVQSDVLKAREQIDKDPRVANIKALLPLYREELHLLTLKPKGGGAPLTFEQLRGKRVAAWGGSLVTAQVVQALTGVGYQIVNAKDQTAALNALQRGQVDAVLAVVGQPATWVKALDGLTLIPIPMNDKLDIGFN